MPTSTHWREWECLRILQELESIAGKEMSGIPFSACCQKADINGLVVIWHHLVFFLFEASKHICFVFVFYLLLRNVPFIVKRVKRGRTLFDWSISYVFVIL